MGTSGPGLWSTFLYYFTSSSLIAVFAITQGLHTESDPSLHFYPYIGGLVFGLLAGSTGAYFNRHISITINSKKPHRLEQHLINQLIQNSYQLVGELEGFTIYQRPNLSGVFSGKLFYQLNENNVIISGRATQVKALRNYLNPKVETDLR